MTELFIPKQSHKVSLPYDWHWTALEWAKDNCPSYITNSGKRDEDGNYFIVYHFGSEQDATLFALRWL